VRTVRTACALLVASLTLAACSGGDGGGDDASSDTSATASEAGGTGGESPACRLLTADEVGDLFGEPASVVPADQDVPVAGGSESCLWEASVDGQSPTIYQLQLSVFTGSDAFDPQAWGDDPEAVEGLGDEAFLVRSGVLGTTAGYRTGDRSVFLSYAIPFGEDAPDSAAQADEVVDLLRIVDERLG
jgi:predicted small secreted protein